MKYKCEHTVNNFINNKYKCLSYKINYNYNIYKNKNLVLKKNI